MRAERPTDLRRFELPRGLQLYLKMEGDTPVGNHKYWLAKLAAHEANHRRCSSVAAGSCGHYAEALSFLCAVNGTTCHAFIPDSMAHHARLGPNTVLHVVPGSYEDAIAACKWFLKERPNIFDANPGAEWTRAAYSGLVQEVEVALGVPPDVVICPVGNGTTLASIHTGCPSRTRIFGVGVPGNRLFTKTNQPDPSLSPLLGDEPTDAGAVEQSVRSSRGALLLVQPEEVYHWSNADASSHVARSVHLCSYSVFAAYDKLIEEGTIGRHDLVVAVLTTGFSEGQS